MIGPSTGWQPLSSKLLVRMSLYRWTGSNGDRVDKWWHYNHQTTEMRVVGMLRNIHVLVYCVATASESSWPWDNALDFGTLGTSYLLALLQLLSLHPVLWQCMVAPSMAALSSSPMRQLVITSWLNIQAQLDICIEDCVDCLTNSPKDFITYRTSSRRQCVPGPFSGLGTRLFVIVIQLQDDSKADCLESVVILTCMIILGK